ncbi:isoprenylcysteine carboxylmethyltransferase family protein [Methylophaga sp.]|uniref:methyltransferase family protein n=1 Tax=Methylophaga sp. TaxID=2024840 RepID=UPI00272123AF|nr:isoprenylcysteine carboxylmethyltransferase family protein [Methylophaga sp.]MDO8827539.1 isoprenylcysteine carboxylmethyltransferase family protein [Methylophaga sp.]
MTDQLSELVLIILIAGAALALFSKNSRWRFSSNNQWDGEVVALTIITLVSMVSIPLIDATLPWIEFADLPYYDEMAWVGIVSGGLGIWLLYRAARDYRAPGKQQKVFVPKGIYCYIRYPFYTALLVLAVAQLLLSQNWLAGVAGLLTFALVYFLRVPREEEDGLEQYGEHYLEYMSRTGDILPRLRLIHQQ